MGLHPRYAPAATPETQSAADRLVGYAIALLRGLREAGEELRAPTDKERAALADLAAALRGLADGADAEMIQYEVYEVGKRHQFEPLRDWFAASTKCCSASRGAALRLLRGSYGSARRSP